MKLYILIKGGGMLVGIFSSMKKMKMVVNSLIKNNYERIGTHGWYHFRYAIFELDEPWFASNGKEETNWDEGRSIMSLCTMHPEYFHHTIENDPDTGEVTNWNKLKDTY